MCACVAGVCVCEFAGLNMFVCVFACLRACVHACVCKGETEIVRVCFLLACVFSCTCMRWVFARAFVSKYVRMQIVADI